MAGPPLAAPLVDLYLDLLGQGGDAPSHGALGRLVQAHLGRFPFENISKLHYLGRRDLRSLPGVELFLQGNRDYGFGGTCYSCNYYFHLLLCSLGYDAALCGADMTDPDVHVVNLVNQTGRQYLVDVGYAAPFLEPLPRDLKDDLVLERGRDRYVLGPQDLAGRSRLELYRDGFLRHAYLVKPQARTIEYFAPAIARSFHKEATFRNALLLARHEPDRSVVVHNLEVTVTAGGAAAVRTLEDRGELAAVVAAEFGIPAGVTDSVAKGLATLGDAWT